MISKKKRIIIFIVFIILVIAVFYILARLGENENNLPDQINKSEEVGEAVNGDNNSEDEVIESVGDLVEAPEIDPATKASMEAQAREMPFPGIEGMGLEFMNDEEKEGFRIPSMYEAQILTRDNDGSISSYKIVKQAEDIIYPN
jgi:hypothetical protein